MTKAHTPSHYKDGYSMVAFCKVCGAEGLRLLDDCPKEVIHTFSIDDIDPRPIDATNQTDKQKLLE